MAAAVAAAAVGLHVRRTIPDYFPPIVDLTRDEVPVVRNQTLADDYDMPVQSALSYRPRLSRLAFRSLFGRTQRGSFRSRLRWPRRRRWVR